MKTSVASLTIKAFITGLLCMSTLVAVPEAEAKSANKKVNTLNGKRVYNRACTVCHATGKDGAPKLEFGFNKRNENWTRRTFDAQKVLADHKEHAYVSVPAPAGQPPLSDQDVVDAVHYIMVMLRPEPVR